MFVQEGITQRRKEDSGATEGGSSDAAVLTSPRVSPAKSRARCEEEKKKEEKAPSVRRRRRRNKRGGAAGAPPLEDAF